MSCFRKASAVGVRAGVDASSCVGRKENLDLLEHRSESTFVVEDEWDTSERMSDYTLSPTSSKHRHDLMKCQSLNQGETMTQVLKGSLLIMPSTPPPLAVSVGSSSFDSREDVEDFKTHQDKGLPPQLTRSKWSEVSPVEYPVRSADYLENRCKQAFDDAVMTLFAVDLVQTDTPTSMCGHPNERLQQSLRLGNAPDYVFAVNLCLPAPKCGTKVKGAFYQFVAYFWVNDRTRLFNASTPVGRLARSFCYGDSDDFRDKTFKLIPKIVHGGGFVFRQAVGTKPVLLGQKVSQRYYRCEDYCEVLVDIASDPIAKRIVRMALGLSTHLTVDLSFCFEGKTEETLPEAILGGVRVDKINFADDGQRYVRNPSATDI